MKCAKVWDLRDSEQDGRCDCEESSDLPMKVPAMSVCKIFEWPAGAHLVSRVWQGGVLRKGGGREGDLSAARMMSFRSMTSISEGANESGNAATRERRCCMWPTACYRGPARSLSYFGHGSVHVEAELAQRFSKAQIVPEGERLAIDLQY
jgi:hypothetical protein